MAVVSSNIKIDQNLKQAVFKLREMSADEKIRECARIREIALRDRNSDLEAARAEGEAQGIAGAVRALMDNMKIGAEQAMDMLGIAKKDREKYFALIN